MCSSRKNGRGVGVKCPCKDCLCVPMCSHKVYRKMVECSLISVYLIDPCTASIRPSDRILEVKKILQPIMWKCSTKRDNTVFVHRRGKNEMSM